MHFPLTVEFRTPLIRTAVREVCSEQIIQEKPYRLSPTVGSLKELCSYTALMLIPLIVSHKITADPIKRTAIKRII